jgi:hypothetical protein
MPLSSETTVTLSVVVAAIMAALPKLLEYVMGERIAIAKKQRDAEDTYRKAIFDDATASRAGMAQFQSVLITRNKELETALEEKEIEIGKLRRRLLELGENPNTIPHSSPPPSSLPSSSSPQS